MPTLSMTQFVDVAAAGGTPKATKIRQIKDSEEYSPAMDFYKKLREALIDIHKNDLPRSAIDSVTKTLTDPKKKTAYPPVIQGYKKWWGKKALQWFDPPYDTYSFADVEVRVNPELGLLINDAPHLLKLYFKSEPISKNKIDVVLGLMDVSLSGEVQPETAMAVLDIRKSKLYTPTKSFDSMPAMINAEMSYISTFWQTAG